MAETVLINMTTGSNVTAPAAFSANTVQSTHSNFNAARSGGTGATFVSASNSLDTSTYLDGSDYKVIRPSILFQIPENLSRLDEFPQLLLYPYNSAATASISVVTNATSVGGNKSLLYGNNGVLGETLFKNTQAVAQASLTQTVPTFTTNKYNVVQLNKLAVYYIAKVKGNFVVTLVNHQYDFGSPAAPSSGQNAHTLSQFRPPGHVNEPILLLRKPWFIDNQGNEFSLDKDFAIKGFEIEANQRNRRVPQLPFSTAVKGPASMRFRNSVYQVTKS